MVRRVLWCALACIVFVLPCMVDVSDAGHFVRVRVKQHAAVHGYASDCGVAAADCAPAVASDCGHVKKERMKTIRVRVPRERVVRHSVDCSASVASDCGYASRVSSDCGVGGVKSVPPPTGTAPVPEPPKE